MAPSDGDARDAMTGSFYDDRGSTPKDAAAPSNGPAEYGTPSQDQSQRQGASIDVASSHDRSQQRQLDLSSETDARQQRPRKDRRPSDKQRICGKCQKQLTGQFVRALGDTYHLECFTCHV